MRLESELLRLGIGELKTAMRGSMPDKITPEEAMQWYEICRHNNEWYARVIVRLIDERNGNANAVSPLYSLKVCESTFIPEGQVWIKKGTLD